MTDDDYMQFFTSCKMIDTGQVSPTAPEHRRARLESRLDSRPLLLRLVEHPASGGELPRALTGRLASSSSWATAVGSTAPRWERSSERNGRRMNSEGEEEEEKLT